MAPFAGSIIDRTVRKKPLLLLPDAASALAVGWVAYFAFTGTIEPWALLMSAAVVAVANSFYAPTVTLLIPRIVARPQLERANALRALTYRVNQLLGPILAGVLLPLGYGIVFAVNALSFVLSGLLEALMRLDGDQASPSEEMTLGNRSLAGGLSWLLGDRRFRRLFATEALFVASIAPMALIIPAYAKAELGGTVQLYSLLLSVIGAGGITAALLVIPRRGLRGGPRSMSFSLALLGVSAAAIGFAPTLPVVVPAFFLFGFGMMTWVVLARSYQQIHLPGDRMGRYFANAHAVAGLLTPAGFLLTGLALNYAPSTAIYYLVAAGMLAAALICSHIEGGREPGGCRTDMQ